MDGSSCRCRKHHQIASANSFTLLAGVIRPSLPWVTQSSAPLRSVAITGSPHAIASSSTSPRPSLGEGWMKTFAAWYRFTTSRGDSGPVTVTLEPAYCLRNARSEEHTSELQSHVNLV